jgi:YHS domain-containing protein
MYRTCRFASWFFVFPLLFSAGGCGSPQVKEPPKSPPPAAAQEKAPEAATEAATAEAPEGLKELSDEDRAAAEKQRTCPVSGELLGGMGKPYKITVEGRTVFLCCPGCEEQFRKDAEKYFAKMKK